MYNRFSMLGYTLIELIVVVVVLTILSVTIAPRFFTTSGTSEYLYQDQLLNLLRRVQMQAMQCTDCVIPTVDITSSSVLVTGTSCSDDSSMALCPSERDAISFSANTTPIGFDSLGRPQGCIGVCQLTVQGASALRVCIETEGYIHPC